MSRRYLSIVSILALTLSACAVGPRYTAPQVIQDNQWYAVLPHQGSSQNLLHWWSQFNDPTLDTLQAAANRSNPTLSAATARIDQARAQLGIASSTMVPNINASGTTVRTNGTDGSDTARRQQSAVIDASWEIDLWGAQRAQRQAGQAQLNASQADWHAARVSVAAEVARNYVDYRACQVQQNLLAEDVRSQERAAHLNGLLKDAGFIAPAESALSDASAASSRQNASQNQARCDSDVKALVALTGLTEAELRLELSKYTQPKVPVAPTIAITQMPVQIVSQRPDVAAAEQRLSAASKQINIAVANRLPRLSLLGNLSFFGVRFSGQSGSYQTSDTWSFGPALSLPIFDAGRLQSSQRLAEAQYAEALAQYRQLVSGAVQEIETSVVQLNSLRQRLDDAKIAADRFNQFYIASQARHEAGQISLLTLEEAHRNQLAAQQNLIALQQAYTTQWINLYKAIGGDWQAQTQTHSVGEVS